MIRQLAVIAAVVASAAPTPAVADGPRQQLVRGRALWAHQHLRDYRFRLRVRCFCPSTGRAVTVTVRNGRASGATGFQRQLDTVPELFAAIERALDDPRAGDVSVQYDAHRGFPRHASIDRIKNAIDDEIGWTIDRFRSL